jgi:hypothetical protein
MLHSVKSIAKKLMMLSVAFSTTIHAGNPMGESEVVSCTSGMWGFFGHKKINEMAIYTLPEAMFGFYKANKEFIVEHAVDPDKRRYGVKGEAECHYIDLDHYCFDTLGCDPMKNVPRTWKAAVEKYTEDSLREHGIVPWHVNLMLMKLTNAFKAEDINRILRCSAEIGHYLGDAHVPLHTTSNYNGQKTGQRGIHGFWESRLPEIYEPNYDFFVGQATYIERPLDFIWARVGESYAAVDSVLKFESELTANFPDDQKYSYETRGALSTRVYSERFSADYNAMLNGQVERRMRQAVVAVGSYWYTAWVNAGQPDLSKLYNAKPSAALLDSLEQENNSKDPQLRTREHE